MASRVAHPDPNPSNKRGADIDAVNYIAHGSNPTNANGDINEFNRL